MKQTYQRSREAEESRNGLIITSAEYGNSEQIVGSSGDTSNELIEVTIPLQVLVVDSRLSLSENSKVRNS